MEQNCMILGFMLEFHVFLILQIISQVILVASGNQLSCFQTLILALRILISAFLFSIGASMFVFAIREQLIGEINSSHKMTLNSYSRFEVQAMETKVFCWQNKRRNRVSEKSSDLLKTYISLKFFQQYLFRFNHN